MRNNVISIELIKIFKNNSAGEDTEKSPIIVPWWAYDPEEPL